MTDIIHGAYSARPADPILPRWWRSVDRWSIAAVLGLFGIGILLGLAASPPLAEKTGLAPFHFVIRQAVFGAVALTAMIFVSMMSPLLVRRIAVFAFICGLIAICLLPIFGTDYGKGAVRWYSLGFTSLQPSEFLKPAFTVTAAWFMAASAEINGPPGKTMSFILAIGIAAILALQPDFGQALLILAVWGVMYFIVGAPIRLLVGLAGGLVAAGVFAYRQSEHFARRIDGFMTAEVDPRTQIGYAANAIQEGGFFGVGVGEGTVKWSLPDAHTDFIIAVAAEEYGLILVLAIIAAYLFIVARSLIRLMRERDPFIRLAGTGLAVLFAMQTLINLGVAGRLLPAKGMTLPFVSYGGSSLLASGIALGMLLAFTRRRPQGAIGDILGGRAHAG